MAAGDINITTPFMRLETLGTGEGIPVVWQSDTIKLMLLTSAFDGSETTHSFVGSVTANEVTAGTAYTAGGPTVTSITVTTSGTLVVVKAGNITIAQDAGGFAAARWGVFYKQKNASSLTDSPIIAVLDLGSDRTNTTGALNINFTGGKLAKKSSTP